MKELNKFAVSSSKPVFNILKYDPSGIELYNQQNSIISDKKD